MQLELKTEGVDFVVSRAPQPKNDNDGRQKPDRETGELLHTTELVAMDDTGAEVIKVTTAGEPKVAKRQLVTVFQLVARRGTSMAVEGWRSAPRSTHQCQDKRSCHEPTAGRTRPELPGRAW